ncbi:hypothetical protein EHF33_11325 [Deinococcus psychrotolerans]|uniref:Alpha/beta hydrolase n=1 Tax=Deinococcus psychrotolerans TaxID=2489213 RepID=A0A3G8YEI6_9DEIO|nr:hypothetical protein [Deinococcus psychrotolerans]AZI43260.1 hypothetical protein EHF33_11325 [Deinococcus psychrotolerans]
MTRLLLLTSAGLALLSACAPMASISPVVYQPPGLAEQLRFTQRPVGSPDVLIFGISGRCGPPCQAPQDNWDYLGERGTLATIAKVFEQRGLKTEVHGYAERITADFTSRRSKLPQRGVLDLLSDYQRLIKAYVTGRSNPARIVLVGHSHGAVWAHYLSTLFGQVPIAALIDLDANCAAWNVDHSPELLAAQSAVWGNDPQRSPLLACNSVLVNGKTVRLKDTVWPNVAVNLEVQSKRWPASSGTTPGLYVNYLFELTPNQRLDGSKSGIKTFVSAREDHSGVSYAKSQAIGWVAQQLETLPWLTQQTAMPASP